jgi:glycosyltransferase involved in cell wall biosynthesis
LRMIKESPRTILIDETLPEDQQNALLAGSMVYISLHRSEGLGLGPLEAAVLDKPVVFTNYGGISELLADHHFPVSYTKILIGADAGPYSDGAMWAEPDLVDAAISLRTAISQVRSGEWKAKQTERAQSMAATLSKIREENIIIIMRLMSVVKDGQELRRVRSRLLSSSVRKVRHGTIRILQGIWRRLPSRARDSLRGPARKLQSVIQGR